MFSITSRGFIGITDCRTISKTKLTTIKTASFRYKFASVKTMVFILVLSCQIERVKLEHTHTHTHNPLQLAKHQHTSKVDTLHDLTNSVPNMREALRLRKTALEKQESSERFPTEKMAFSCPTIAPKQSTRRNARWPLLRKDFINRKVPLQSSLCGIWNQYAYPSVSMIWKCGFTLSLLENSNSKRDNRSPKARLPCLTYWWQMAIWLRHLTMHSRILRWRGPAQHSSAQLHQEEACMCRLWFHHCIRKHWFGSRWLFVCLFFFFLNQFKVAAMVWKGNKCWDKTSFPLLYAWDSPISRENR